MKKLMIILSILSSLSFSFAKEAHFKLKKPSVYNYPYLIDYYGLKKAKKIIKQRYYQLTYISASEFGIHRTIDYRDKSVSEQTHQNFRSFLQEKYEQTGDDRLQALSYATELQREFGLRFRESAGLNSNTIEKALETGKLVLGREDWTKNAREREIEIRSEEQKNLLIEVKDFLEKNNSINLAGAENTKEYQPIAEFRSFADYIRNEFNTEFNEEYNYHGERHAWAQEMYSSLWEEKTGVEILSPIEYYTEQLVGAGWDPVDDMVDNLFYEAIEEHDITPWWEYVQEQLPEYDLEDLKEIDHEIRWEISEELGHSRLDITNTYLGHP
jgi:hypothetical protein